MAADESSLSVVSEVAPELEAPDIEEPPPQAESQVVAVPNDSRGSADDSRLGAGDSRLSAGIDENGPLQTLTSGLMRELKGGMLQAHICVVEGVPDVGDVMAAFRSAPGFKACVNWSWAYRIVVRKPGSSEVKESGEDDMDEGCGEKILAVLRRFDLTGLLLVVSRWQELGATSGLELFGTSLYSLVTERCKDLVMHLKKAVSLPSTASLGSAPPAPSFAALEDHKRLAASRTTRKIGGASYSPAGDKRSFDFGFLPPLPGKRVKEKYSPNSFQAEMSAMGRSDSMPALFSGQSGVKMVGRNNRCLRELSKSETSLLKQYMTH